MSDKVYLGDAVYVERSPLGDIMLTTENGIRVTNRIILEPEVVRKFAEWIFRENLDVRMRSDPESSV